MLKRLRSMMVMALLLAIGIATNVQGGIDEFPDTDFTDIDGNEHNLRDYLAEGKIVIMAYWVASESSCIAKLPALEEVWQAHGPNGTNTTMLLGIEGAGETIDAAVQAVKNNGSATYPLINTVAGCSDKPNCGNPHYYVVCPDGGGTWSYVNQNLSGDQLVAHIGALIGSCEVFERDASVLNTQSFDNVICEETVQPSLTLYNRGTEVLSTLDLQVEMAGEVIATQSWMGSLEQFETTVVTLDAFAAPAETGVYEMTIRAVNPNGGADQNIVNDEKDVSMVVIAPELRDELSLFVSPDFYPQEVQWNLQNTDGVILGHGEGYTGDFLETICVERGACYEFILYDANADGFDMGHGELYQNGCEIFAFTSDDHNGLHTKFEFCLSAEFDECDEVPDEPVQGGNTTTDLEEVSAELIQLFPNPASGSVSLQLSHQTAVYKVQLLNVSGQLIEQINFVDNDLSFGVDHLEAGIYLVSMLTEKGVSTEKLMISK